MNKSKAIIKEEKAPKKKENVKREGNKFVSILAACIGSALVIGLCLLVYFDYLYAAPCVKVDGESYNVNDIEVRYNVYNAEAMVQMDAAIYYTSGTYSTMEEYWDTASIKENAVSMAKNASVRNLIMYKEAVKHGVSLTEEEKKASKDKATAFYEAMSDAHKKRAKFSSDELIEYYQVMDLANKYIDQIKAGYNVTNETLETPIKESDYDEIKFKVIVTPTTTATSTDEVGKKFDDKTLATYKAKMEEYLKQAKNGKDLSEIVAEEDSAIYQYMETTLERGTEAYEKLLNALETLKDGELYQSVIDDDKAYYIVQMVDKNSKDSYESAVKDAITTQEETLFNADLDKLVTEYDVKIGSGWDKIVPGTVVVYPGEDVSEFTSAEAQGTSDEEDASASPAASESPAASSSASPAASASPKEENK